MRKIRILIIFFMLLNFSLVYNTQISGAKVSNEAMKFLWGTWVTVGNSQAEKVIFTKKYAKTYSLWNKDNSKVYSYKKKGKFIGKRKIISVKKKGRKWIVKLKGGTYFVGYGDGLTCQWKESGKWQYSYSDSLNRVSKHKY